MLSNGHLNSKIYKTLTKTAEGFVSKERASSVYIFVKTKQIFLDKISNYLIPVSIFFLLHNFGLYFIKK